MARIIRTIRSGRFRRNSYMIRPDFEANTSSLSSMEPIDKEFLEDSSSTSSSDDFSSNRQSSINQQWSRQFLDILGEEDFEFGYEARSEVFVRNLLMSRHLEARNWLNELFICNFTNDKITIGILRILARFKEEMIFPQGQTIALAALSHQNDEIKELGVRAFETWVSKDSIDILKKISVGEKWLQEYINQVIIDLTEALYADDASSKNN